MNEFLYLPARGRIETAIPLTQIVRVDYHRARQSVDDRYEVVRMTGNTIEMTDPPYMKSLIFPDSWERWSVGAVADGPATLCHWTSAPVMSAVQCTPVPSGSIWFEDIAAHGEADPNQISVVVDVKRQACWLAEDWSSNIVQACEELLSHLKRSTPELASLDLPPWLVPAAKQPLRKSKAA